MLHLLAMILLSVSGVLTQNSDFGVIYPDKPICAGRGFSVSLPCSYSYPWNHHVTQTLWCSMNSNTNKCINPPYVYNSSSHTRSDFQFAGDDKSNCTLLIHNVQMNYSGVYKFRFITNANRYTGDAGVTLQVADLKVSLIRLSGNGTLKQGDSLNLTCDVNCTHTSSQFVWSKNNQPLNASGRVLHFPTVTLQDSGNYTCTWKTNLTSGSKMISLHVEDLIQEQNQMWIIILVVVVVCVVIAVIVAAVIFLRRRRLKAAEGNSEKIAEKSQVGENTHHNQPKPQRSDVPQAGNDETLYKEEVTYADVCVKDEKVTQGRVHSERQKEDDSVIYSTVIHT